VQRKTETMRETRNAPPCYIGGMLVHINGQLVPVHEARVSAFDRGFLFADGIYEGLRSFNHDGERRLIAPELHVRRMARGLERCGIAYDPAKLLPITHELLRVNNLDDAFVYWQVTRGTPDLHGGPVRERVRVDNLQPTVMAYVKPIERLDVSRPEEARPAVKKASLQVDERWLVGEVKSISLLGNVLAALAGVEASGIDGAAETILCRAMPDGTHVLSEGTYTNIALVIPKPGFGESERLREPLKTHEVLTPSLESTPILNGVTRAAMLALCPDIREARLTTRDLARCSELLLLGTTTMITSITHVDGRAIGTGAVGPVAMELSRFWARALKNRDDLRAFPGVFEKPIAKPNTVVW
jgi:D-alanine transaminase